MVMKTVSIVQGHEVMKTVSISQGTCGDEDCQHIARYMW